MSNDDASLEPMMDFREHLRHEHGVLRSNLFTDEDGWSVQVFNDFGDILVPEDIIIEANGYYGELGHKTMEELALKCK